VLLIVPSLVLGTGKARDRGANTSSPIRPIPSGRQHFVADNASSPILRDDNDFDEDPHYEESDDAGRPLLHAKRMRLNSEYCKRNVIPKTWPCYRGWKYICFERRCRRTVRPINQGSQKSDFFYNKNYVKCDRDSDCLTYWKNQEKKTPGFVPCIVAGRWYKYPCEKGFRWGCARYGKKCWRELENQSWEYLREGVDNKGKKKTCRNDSECEKLAMRNWWPEEGKLWPMSLYKP